MKAVAVNGSPRKGGNTETMLRRVLGRLDAAGWETEFVQVGGKTIRGCQACYKCFENKDHQCTMKKDSFNEVAEKLFACDAMILGSPTYFSDVSAELKALIDRAGLVSLANGRLFSGKIGAAVIAVRRGGGTHAFDSINHLFLMSRMIVPGSIYWNLGYGLKKGEVSGDEEAMQNMDGLGDTIAWLGEAIRPRIDSFPK